MYVRIGDNGGRRQIKEVTAVKADGGVSVWMKFDYGNVDNLYMRIDSETLSAIVKAALTGETTKVPPDLAELSSS
ncbi:MULTISPECIES: hypothetical protein [Methylorubrum]|uniref:hypothetical protein n=1 Tax=Methylorubrum TaxID=2282523 RepID=UPI00218A16B4|nr:MULTISPECIES: hypothetical protein [Methylorubrum]UYW32499.1 hypothetical protein OKB92_26640 [Methylorubrum extorquens]BDL40942.1 hypothetical protein MSPGM_35320 [Methylorubrum sp. GM97]